MNSFMLEIALLHNRRLERRIAQQLMVELLSSFTTPTVSRSTSPN